MVNLRYGDFAYSQEDDLDMDGDGGEPLVEDDDNTDDLKDFDEKEDSEADL